jgi:transposase
VERARIVLLAALGLRDKDIAAKLSITAEKAARWRNRFLDLGLTGLDKDAPRPGRRLILTPDRVQEVIRKTTEEPPPSGARWSARAIARAVGISDRSVRRIWKLRDISR